MTSWEPPGPSCFGPQPCSCRVMSCWQLRGSVSSSWVPLGLARQLWENAGAEVPPAGCCAPAPGPHRTRCCCRWAKLPPGEQNFPQSDRLLLSHQLPSLSWHIPAEANVCVCWNAELRLSLREERAGAARAGAVLEEFRSLSAEQASAFSVYGVQGVESRCRQQDGAARADGLSRMGPGAGPSWGMCCPSTGSCAHQCAWWEGRSETPEMVSKGSPRLSAARVSSLPHKGLT